MTFNFLINFCQLSTVAGVLRIRKVHYSFLYKMVYSICHQRQDHCLFSRICSCTRPLWASGYSTIRWRSRFLFHMVIVKIQWEHVHKNTTTRHYRYIGFHALLVLSFHGKTKDRHMDSREEITWIQLGSYHETVCLVNGLMSHDKEWLIHSIIFNPNLKLSFENLL